MMQRKDESVMAIFYDKIVMEVTDDDDWRYQRLHVVIGYLYAIDKFFIDVINGMKDEEGTLMINWEIQPLPSMIKACQHIWHSDICCESPESIEHYVKGQRFYIKEN